MYNQPYFIPGYYSNMTAPAMMRGAMGGALRGASSTALANRGLGLFSRLGSSIQAIKSVNWSGFITNASKTLGVINQTIPLVRQVGPMFNNMRSMLRLASIFKDETDKNRSNSTNRSLSNQINSSTKNSSFQSSQRSFYSEKSNLKTNKNNSQIDYTNYDTNDYSPTFFIES